MSDTFLLLTAAVCLSTISLSVSLCSLILTWITYCTIQRGPRYAPYTSATKPSYRRHAADARHDSAVRSAS